MRRFLEKKYANHVIAGIVIAIIAIFISTGFIYIYETNDDYIISTILSGEYTGNPSAYSIHIFYPLSILMKVLYEIVPEIHWYGMLLIGGHYLGLFLILARVLEMARKVENKIFILVCSIMFIFCVDLKFIIYPQYTVTAGVLAAAAVFLLATMKYKERIREYVIPTILLILTLNLRREAFYISLLFAIFAVLWTNVSDEKEQVKKSIKKQIIIWGSFICVIALNYMIHNIAYSSSEWKEYTEFNAARTTVYDYTTVPSYAGNEVFYNSVGINNGMQLHVLQSQNVSFWSTIDNKMMLSIAEKSEELKSRSVLLEVVPKYYAWATSGSPILLAIYLSFLVIFCISVISRDYRYILGAILTDILKSGMICYLIYKGRYIDRATYPINLFALIVMIAILFSYVNREEGKVELSKINSRIKFVTFALACLSMLFVCVMMQRDYWFENQELIESRSWQPTVTEYFSDHPDNIYFTGLMGIGPLRSPVFEVQHDLGTNWYIMGGWPSHSPTEKLSFSQNGIISPDKALIEKENTYWVQIKDYPIEWILEIVQEAENEYEVILEDEIVMQNKVEYNVYKIYKR